MITKVGDDPFGGYIRGALAEFGVDAALRRHRPVAAHAAGVLRDPPARRLPAALLPRAERARPAARGRRARRGGGRARAALLGDRHRAVGRAEPRDHAGGAHVARRRADGRRPRLAADVLGAEERARDAADREAVARDGRGRQPRGGRRRASGSGEPLERRGGCSTLGPRARRSSSSARAACSPRRRRAALDRAADRGRGRQRPRRGRRVRRRALPRAARRLGRRADVRYANAAGALVASRLGCADDMPTAAEVEALL